VDRLLIGLLGLWAALSLAPVGAWAGLGGLDAFRDTWALWGRTLAVAGLATALLLVGTRGRAAAALRSAWRRVLAIRPAQFAIVTGSLAAVEAAAVALVCFARQPQTVDAWIQFFQARVFLDGRIVAPPPPSVAHFTTLHALVTPELWASQYPPVHAALLALGMAAGTAWIVTPLLTGLLPPAVYALGRRTGDERVARTAALLVLLSPFVAAMGASAMNHVPAALAVALGLWAIPGVARGRTGGAAACGMAVGLLAGLRPLEAVLLAALGAGALLGALRTAGAWRAAVAMAAAGTAATLPTLVYNAITTGDPLTFTYSAVWGERLRLGLDHEVPWGPRLTALRALAHTAADGYRLNVHLLEWPLPVTVLAAAAGAGGRLGPGLRAPATFLLALVGALFFYFHRDVLYGPRFLFSALPAVFVLVAAGVVRVAGSRRSLGWRGLVLGDVALVLVVVVGVLAATTLAPRRLATYRTTGTALALDPEADARGAGIRHAVVLMPDGWGSRLVARLWAAGVGGADAERLYRAFDACALEERLATAEARGDRGPALVAALTAAAAGASPGRPIPGATRDPNLRLPADGRLTPRCLAELERDRRGTIQFAPYLHLNAPALDGDIVWARELGPQDAALRTHFPDRTFYRYTTPTPGTPPTFTRLDDMDDRTRAAVTP
jgi:hypothetical protein